MSGLYSIPLAGLKEGVRSFEFNLGSDFFKSFEGSEIEEGELLAEVRAEKRSTHLDLEIKISGFVMIACDRCLGIFAQPVGSENRLLVKFGHVHDESDPDIFTVPFDEHELDLSQYLYESVLLALPIKRIHPADEAGNYTCDSEMLKHLGQHLVGDDKKNNDPRWDELKKLMNN